MPLFKINEAHLMEAVYSYPFPEVRALLDTISLPAAFMLNTLPTEQATPLLHSYNFTPALALPSTPEGTLDLDELHVPIINRLRTSLHSMLPGLETFPHAYPTPGSSQAIFTMMAEWKASGELQSIAMLEGDYEGYNAYAKSLAIPITTYKDFQSAPKKGEVWFISNPSAVDGNIIDETIWHTFVNAGHQIVYDAAYLGLTIDGRVDIHSPNIKAVVVSPSKVFGVFRYRHTGLCFTRQPVSALYGSKWFKDIPALLDTLLLYETFASHELPLRYREAQKTICIELSNLVGAPVLPSDTLLLAHTREKVAPTYQKYSRINGLYRFGLTKLLEDFENM